jgi:hypothetical protein
MNKRSTENKFSYALLGTLNVFGVSYIKKMIIKNNLVLVT